uniref:J domain-containing protein n=1 Tax=viral metagenome TaxID=1070528 RepID=A0A6C0DRF2_9ZZZZ
MDYKKACEVLQLSQDFDVDLLKQQYRLNALRHHPDKNKDSSESTQKFQEINEAYSYLLNRKDSDNDIDGDYDYEFNSDDYNGVLFTFLKDMFKQDNFLLASIIHKITDICESKAVDLLLKIDKTILIKVYEFMKLYRDVFYFSEDFYSKLENIMKAKFDNDECIILHPLLDDLLENNLYKMKIENNTYIIPLWYDELVYDHNGYDIYFKCYPILPNNMTIDANNNLHINVSFHIGELLLLDDNGLIDINVGNRTFQINVNQLKIKREQIIVLKKEGITKINNTDIYDISRKADIYLHITLQ